MWEHDDNTQGEMIDVNNISIRGHLPRINVLSIHSMPDGFVCTDSKQTKLEKYAFDDKTGEVVFKQTQEMSLQEFSRPHMTFMQESQLYGPKFETLILSLKNLATAVSNRSDLPLREIMKPDEVRFFSNVQWVKENNEERLVCLADLTSTTEIMMIDPTTGVVTDRFDMKSVYEKSVGVRRLFVTDNFSKIVALALPGITRGDILTWELDNPALKSQLNESLQSLPTDLINLIHQYLRKGFSSDQSQ